MPKSNIELHKSFLKIQDPNPNAGGSKKEEDYIDKLLASFDMLDNVLQHGAV